MKGKVGSEWLIIENVSMVLNGFVFMFLCFYKKFEELFYYSGLIWFFFNIVWSDYLVVGVLVVL